MSLVDNLETDGKVTEKNSPGSPQIQVTGPLTSAPQTRSERVRDLSRLTKVSTPSIALQDYEDLLVLLSARAACFEFLDAIDVDLPVSEIVPRLWSAHSKCIKANHLFARFCGASDPAHIMGRSFGALIPHTVEQQALLQRWVENNFFVQKCEVRERGADGIERVVESSMNASFERSLLKKVWIITKDVTDRRRMVSSLQEAEQHYRSLVERPGQVMARSRPDGSYLYISPNAYDMFGYTLADFNATPGLFKTLLHPDDIEKHEPILEARRTKDTRTVEVEFRVRHKDGSYHWFFERQMPKLNEAGQIEYYDSIALDIQEKKQLEAELRHAQRMEVVGTLAGGIAHDFNNHLTAVLGQITITLEQIGPSHSCYQKLAAAEQGALCCAEITKQLLAFGRKSDPSLKPLDAKKLVTDVGLLLGHVLPSRIQLSVEIGDDVRGILGDHAQVQQVIMNLAVNARDAMPSGGSLRLNARRREISEAGECRFYPQAAPGKYVELVVSDTGLGIPPSHLPRIFEPFFTTKAEGKGTGLGLSMVYSIVTSHGGWVSVSSEVGHGTTFSLIIPAVDIVGIESPDSRRPQKLSGDEVVLLADDDDMIRAMARTALSLQGYTVIEAANGEEAVRRFQEHKNEISLVLVDETMPKKSGREVIIDIQSRSPTMKFILTSGYGKKVLDSGFPSDLRMHFINKPYLLSDLFSLMRSMLD